MLALAHHVAGLHLHFSASTAFLLGALAVALLVIFKR